jgi:hypothetical protein
VKLEASSEPEDNKIAQSSAAVGYGKAYTVNSYVFGEHPIT